MWHQNIILKFIFVLWISSKVVTNSTDYFPNFICGEDAIWQPKKCKISGISSTDRLQEIFQYLGKYDFKDENLNRSEISYYNKFEFINSTFEKFPVGSFGNLSHVKSLIARNVNLLTLNRDSLTSFTSLEYLDLSHNNIQLLENNILSYLKSLKSFNLCYNQIEIINKYAFDEMGKNLTNVNLSHNHIKTVDERIFETLGKIDRYISFHLEFNYIEEISVLSASKVEFYFLDISHNKLKNFRFKCKKINDLIFGDNHVDKVNPDYCLIKNLNLKNNYLINIEIFDVLSLDISDNINIKNISLNFKVLNKFVASNASSEAVNYEFLQNAHQLTELDMSNTFLGTPKIGTFSEMTQLVDLKLRNTGLSHIEYGMFGHQVYVRNFDISYNDLRHIDIEMLSSIKVLESLDISGNNLTSFNDVNDFNRNFPNLNYIGIDDNNWNCSYLAKIVKEFSEIRTSVLNPAVIIKNSSHVMGIGCTTTSNQKNKPIDESLNTGITNILLTANLIVLVVIGGVFGYFKLKNIYYRRYETPSALARSTNSQTPPSSENLYEIPLNTSKCS